MPPKPPSPKPPSPQTALRDTLSDMRGRGLAIALFLPLTLFAVWIGGVWFNLAVALAGLIIAFEWTRMVSPASRAQLVLHGLTALAGTLGIGFFGWGLAAATALALWIISVALPVPPGQRKSRWLYFGVPYVFLSLAALVEIRGDASHGAFAILWLLIVVWSADSLAYLFGRLIGGPKLWPAVSPNKTWAGLFGAVFGAGLASILFTAILDFTGIAILCGMALVAGLVEQAGDLFESALKRRHNTKDSGAIMPGHGGLLDRLDGLLAAAVVACLFGVARAGRDHAGAGLLVW